MEDKITCKYCGSMNVAKKGARKIRHGSRHIYSCKDCFKKFSIGLNKKQFDAWLIVNAVCLYNKGYSYEEACEFIARKHKVQVGKSSVERWAKEYGLGFLDLRDRIISKYGRDCIIERAFNHSGLVYNFMLHKGKLKEFGKFSGLKDFIFSLAKGVDEKFFNGERCSQSSEGISCKIDVSENARLNSVVGEMLKIVKSNRQRHMLVENLMLHCDRDSVAVEVPVWYWNKKINGGVCGHIDVLQVKFGKVWILDYKPDAEKENFERVMSQLYNYALALSFRSGLALRDIKCAWFDSSRIYSFEPEKVVFLGKDKIRDEKAEKENTEEKKAEDEKTEEHEADEITPAQEEIEEPITEEEQTANETTRIEENQTIEIINETERPIDNSSAELDNLTDIENNMVENEIKNNEKKAEEKIRQGLAKEKLEGGNV